MKVAGYGSSAGLFVFGGVQCDSRHSTFFGACLFRHSLDDIAVWSLECLVSLMGRFSASAANAPDSLL